MIGRLGLAVGLVACASSHGPREHHVDIRLMQFVPRDLEVDVGDTVVWTNHDVMPHTATSTEFPAFDSGAIEHRKSWRMTVTTPGTVDYVCLYHPTMIGTMRAR